MLCWVCSGHVTVVRDLVKRGADTRHKMNQQTTPMDVALEFSAPAEILDILRAATDTTSINNSTR